MRKNFPFFISQPKPPSKPVIHQGMVHNDETCSYVENRFFQMLNQADLYNENYLIHFD